MVVAGGDADLTDLPDLPCACSPSPARSVSLVRRRRPSAARSLLRNPPPRSSTCGTSSGRRVMAPASLHNNHEAAPGTRERWPSTPGHGLFSEASPSPDCRPPAAPTTECRKPRRHRSTTKHRPRSFPRSRSNLQHRPDGTPIDPVALALGRALRLAEWSSRRYTRSPGEAGGGRSDLCHDNDEPDPVNRRGRIGDNPVDPTTELRAGASGLLELLATRLPSGDEELPADPQERKPELGDNGECSQCPGSRHVEGLAGGSSAVVLEARMHHLDVGEVELGGGCRHPVQPAALRIDQGERRCSME